MRREKLLLSAFAIILGIVVAIVIFYFYESSHQVKPSEIQKLSILSPTPAQNSMLLVINNPLDQSVFTNRNITVSGKTAPGAKIAIITQTSEVAAVAANDGSFSTNVTIDDGQNILEVDAISTDGEMAKVTRTVTYSTESF